MRVLLALLLAVIAGLPQIRGQWTYTVATVAGSDWVGDHGPATQALLFQAEGLTTDAAGNLYIAEAQGHRVRQVSPAGVISTIAGTGQPGFSGDGGPAAAAQLNAPYGLAFDNHGNLYIADLGNARVRRVAPDGTIATVASAALISPRNLALDFAGNLYISDFDGQQVYKLGPDGVLAPFVTSGLRYPTALAIDRSGVLYIADSENHLVRKFDRGVLTSVAAAATPTGLAFDASGTLYIADSTAGRIVKVPPAGGPVSTLPVSARDLAFASDGSLFATAGTLVSRVLPGTPRIVAGGGSTAFGDYGDARIARLNHPTGVAADALGNVYIADRDNHRIRRVSPDGIITTIAGTGAQGNTGDGGPATLARLNGPTSVSLDAAGNLYVADTGNHRVRKFTPGGIMLAVTDTVSPVDTAADSAGNLYIADSGARRIYRAAATGVVVPFLDGFQSPGGVALDRDGNLYYTDSAAGRVWRRGVSGVVTELGAGGWINPRGVAVSESGDIFVADSGLGRVFRVDSFGSAVPLAIDGAIGTPWAVAIGPAGTLYVADPDGNRVRILTVTSVDAVNAASLLPGPLAPGMLVAILGTGNAGGVLATEVSFAGYPAAILALDASRILVQAPVQIAGMSQVEIKVASAIIVATVADAAPALFTTGSGQVAAVNEDGTPNSAEHPVSRGSWVSFYATGEGVAGLPVAVRIGGYAAEVLYSGAVAGYPGLFQINARIPAGYMAPGILNVVVTVGDAPSQAGVTIAVQ
ncbi:MAG: repeat containing protein [Bryobacterales bacterium]|nr:repeat containing protein [Bryobacterales bacterium]